MAPMPPGFDVDTIVRCNLWADRRKPGIKPTYSYVDLDPQPHNPIFFFSTMAPIAGVYGT